MDFERSLFFLSNVVQVLVCFLMIKKIISIQSYIKNTRPNKSSIIILIYAFILGNRRHARSSRRVSGYNSGRPEGPAQRAVGRLGRGAHGGTTGGQRCRSGNIRVTLLNQLGASPRTQISRCQHHIKVLRNTITHHIKKK